jgi:hypothetical protein
MPEVAREVNCLEPGVGPTDRVEHFRRAVLAAVVDENDLELEALRTEDLKESRMESFDDVLFIETRDGNGKYLAARLGRIPGVYPQKRSPECTRHSYHLFMFRLEQEQFGAPRSAVLEALRAEGIPCSAGYGFSLHHQPLFRNKAFGPYLAQARARLNYDQMSCPHSDLICREQSVWFEQNMLLGARADMDDIARALEKIHENRGTLQLLSRSPKSSKPYARRKSSA